VWRRRPTPGFAPTGTMPSLLALLDERDERVDARVFAPHAEAEATGIPSNGTGSPIQRPLVLHPPTDKPREHGRAVGHWPGRLRRLGTIVE
jgi:hypothetical protein